MKIKESSKTVFSSLESLKEERNNRIFDGSSKVPILAIGILGYIAVSLSAHLTGTSFNGVLDVHYVEYQSLTTAFWEGFVNIGILIAVYCGLNYYLTQKIHLLGIVSAVLISRLPFIVFTIFNIENYIRYILVINLAKMKHGLYDFYTTDLIVLGFFIIITLVILIYSVLILYKGFSSSLGFSLNRKGKILFFIPLLIAELLSKSIISVA